MYRRTTFQLDDIDEALQFLIAAGQIGRQNITSLEFSWSSRIDLEHQWSNTPPSEELLPSMPSFHVEECVKLLEQCQNLKIMQLRFDGDIVGTMSSNDYRANEGLNRPRCVHGLENLDILDMSCEPLDHAYFAEWLKEAMLLPKPSVAFVPSHV